MDVPGPWHRPPHPFSARQELIRYAVGHSRVHSKETSSLSRRLLEEYPEEGRTMGYALQEFAKRVKKEALGEASVEERLVGIPPAERVKGLSPDELLAAVSPDVRGELARRLRQQPPG